MASKVKWQLRFRLDDGAFYESVNSADAKLSYAWGFEGVGSGLSWELDSSGVVRQLVLDDHESSVLSAWARVGIYNLPQLSDYVQVEGEGVAQVRLKGGKLIASLSQCPLSLQTMEITQQVLGSSETWTLSSYKPIDLKVLKGIMVATKIEHKGSSTSKYRLEEVEHIDKRESSLYQMPLSPLLPSDTTFESKDGDIPIWSGSTNHLLVKPKVTLSNETLMDGYWILDTGASGFVIANKGKSSDRQIGELMASGVSGKAAASVIRAASLSLGPLTIHDPLMMVMDLTGLVKGKTIDGILGYDLFRRCVLEVTYPQNSCSQKSVRSKTSARSLVSSQPSFLTIRSPEDPIELLTHNWQWMDLILISCLPHVHASFQDASGREHTLLFLLDTGASGAGLFIHDRAVKSLMIDLKFPSSHKDERSASHQMKGVGGGGSVNVDLVEIPHVTLGSKLRVDCVRCVITKDSGSAGIDLSLYSCGIIGSDLIQGLPYCLDLTRSRLGFLL